MSRPRRLTQLDDGAAAVVTGYDASIPESRRERFEDLGLLPNTPILRERTAPFGDPLLFRVRGSLLCLRRSDAEFIRIHTRFEREPAAHPAALDSEGIPSALPASA
ncbi:MAG: ferrous iron transport protein A [Elusimicrobia bacterium]|nr:ferrous iron transport protein A [Elusimicrobiota bacterium]